MITIGSIRDVDLDLARELSETSREAGVLDLPQAARVAAANEVLQGAAIELAAESEAAGVAAQAALKSPDHRGCIGRTGDARRRQCGPDRCGNRIGWRQRGWRGGPTTRRHGRRDGEGEANPLEFFTAACALKGASMAATGHAGPNDAEDVPREFAAPGGVTWIRVTVAMAAATLLAAHLLQPHGKAGDATYLSAVCGAAAIAWVGALRRPRGASRILVPYLVHVTANAVFGSLAVILL
jgi:hypothetical protein